jgi:hypothetical protein
MAPACAHISACATSPAACLRLLQPQGMGPLSWCLHVPGGNEGMCSPCQASTAAHFGAAHKVCESTTHTHTHIPRKQLRSCTGPSSELPISPHSVCRPPPCCSSTTLRLGPTDTTNHQHQPPSSLSVRACTSKPAARWGATSAALQRRPLSCTLLPHPPRPVAAQQPQRPHLSVHLLLLLRRLLLLLGLIWCALLPHSHNRQK